ncbi:uncharacterized protein LOC111884932 isoform X1 [Lactuca sativa]|uniref:Uncharacterized protein n=1 Tax=Lactuca sativa TaxID=4236 RepID=A0A9R1XL19_LACSA|nr:uncharacterized protein LOC111884932 isoform X1 [Lactuca sativa]KAJ0211472.1 hypothetical protein LSAT_V11C400222370 [Lactuca sativa]
MAVSAWMVVAMKTLFSILACVMFATLLWATAMDGLASCIDLRDKWLVAALVNFYINFAFIGAWIVYKESSLIKAVILISIAIIVGSVVTCGYIALQFFKLSREESSKDPLYFVLVRHQKKDALEHMRGPSVVTARVIISSLGFLILGTFIYTFVVYGSPIRVSTCMIAVVIDFYFHVVALSVWVAYKESSWISAFFWILSLVCCGSIATCVYIVKQLFYLSPEQPVSLVLVNNSNRNLLTSDPLLMANTNA